MLEIKDKSFSNIDRLERLVQCSSSYFDLIIIGGGITGAGIALDASLRGLRTILLEKKDFASGTSSKSTKLIHGGLRYLKQLELGLVKETGQERAVAHRNIPHLVHPEKMLLPLVKNGTFGKLSASVAIAVYDRLANVPDEDRKKTFNKKETLELEPLLNKKILKSSIQYSEYRTDDARLTIELIKAARREGAEAFNYMEVNDFIYVDGKVKGVVCKDHIDGETKQFSAEQVVSAAGPWVDHLRKVNNSKTGKSLQLTKGVHIVLPKDLLPLSSSVYFDAFDGRMLFAIPRGKVVYVGTSDTNYKGDKERVVCTTSDAEYILKAVNLMFDVEKIHPQDIVSTWAGLRPLIHEDGKSPSELSRRDEIFVSNSDLISIAGGKLTGFRKMAQRVVDLVQKNHPTMSSMKCQTKNYKIHYHSFEDYSEFKEFTELVFSTYKNTDITEYDAWYYVSTFGKHAIDIIKKAISSGSAQKSTSIEHLLLESEIDFCIKYESCYMPEDFFNRRTGRIYFDIDSVIRNLRFILSVFKDRFGWSNEHFEQRHIQSKNLISEANVIQP